jgi:hypothetical protein
MSRVASARQRSSSRFLARVLPGAKPASFPGFIEPALATLRAKVPTGARFVHELKLDGYRVQAHLLDGRVTLYTRTGLDWTTLAPTPMRDVRSFTPSSSAASNMLNLAFLASSEYVPELHHPHALQHLRPLHRRLPAGEAIMKRTDRVRCRRESSRRLKAA